MTEALAKAFKRPFFVAGASFLAAGVVLRFVLGTPNGSIAMLLGSLLCAVLILSDIRSTNKHGY